MEPIRLGVLGLGKMGRHHLRCAGLAAGVELAAAGDTDGARGADVPDGVPFTTDLDELLARVDAVVVAIPTAAHARIGRRILEAGKHLLLEKPFAVTVAECDDLEAAAERAGRVLRVGHVERMNGAYRAARPRITTPRFVEGHRLAGFDPRGTDVDVVLDLMIHDLDLVLDLHRCEPERVDAVGVSVLTDRVDIANARLEFPGGELVNLTASRVSREPVRKLRIFQEDAYLSLDFQTQRAELYGRDGAAPLGIRHDKLDAPEGHNPLVEELLGFAAAIRGEESEVATAEDGRRAVALAARIRESMERRASRFAESAGG
ncbi:Gfo/Idh/MocA family oxidoreductase, partial [bacterium]|nr:Gfo/Idh/MocA family oxidoreductase [bacterium]